jgi:hypothetical protein
MKNGQRQPKNPTKKESIKIQRRLITEKLEEIRGRILEITDDWDNEYVPLNLLGVELNSIRFKDDDMLEFKGEKEAFNKMLYKIMEQAETSCKTFFLNERLPMKSFDIIIDFWIAATAITQPVKK